MCSRNSTLIAAVVAVVFLPSTLSAQSATPAEPVVVVTGDGLVKAAPDRAWVTFAVESRSRNPKEAQSQSATAMTAIQQKLLSAGLSKDAIRTLSVDLQMESDFINGRQVPRGYVARNTIEVRLDDI
ncbi:MAG: SIMPL domain-containing protein, partial [Vicinamibacterales bacterium]